MQSGHESNGLSRNIAGNTPLMAAVEAGQEKTAEFLARAFPACIEWENKIGMDVVCPALPPFSLPTHPSTPIPITNNIHLTALS